MIDKKYIVWMISVLSFVLVSCSPSDSPSSAIDPKQDKEPEMIPIALSASEELQQVYLFVDRFHILFSVAHEGQFELRKGNIQTGTFETIYTAPTPIVDVHVHPSTQQMIIQLASTQATGEWILLDEQGQFLWRIPYEGQDVVLNWSIAEPNQVFVSTFQPDWSYDSFVLLLREHEKKYIHAPHPFLQWGPSNDLFFVDPVEEDIARGRLKQYNWLADETVDLETSALFISQYRTSQILTVIEEDQFVHKWSRQEHQEEWSSSLVSNYGMYVQLPFTFLNEEEWLELVAVSPSSLDDLTNEWLLLHKKNGEVVAEYANWPYQSELICNQEGACLRGEQFEKIQLGGKQFEWLKQEKSIVE